MIFGNSQDYIQLIQFLYDDDHALAALRSGKGKLYELFIFEAV